MESTELKECKPRRTGLFHALCALPRRILTIVSLSVILAVVILIAVWRLLAHINQPKEPPAVNVLSMIEEVVHTSRLSTFSTVYEGVTQVMNEKKPDKVDYYVSYCATVKAGLDFSRIAITMDDTTIYLTLPPIEMEAPEVDISSLDYLFYNNKANTSSVTEAAYRACVADVTQAMADNPSVVELAQSNAKQVLTALVTPFLSTGDQVRTVEFLEEDGV